MSTQNTMLRNIALVGKLSITNWEAKKKAKDIEAEAEQKSGAKHGSVSARKSLLPGATELEAVIKHAATMRTWWNLVSMPWFDNGMRVYNVAGHLQIQQQFGDLARERDQLVREFLDKYGELREQARFDLNDLFTEQDYPTRSEVASRFTCAFEVMPLPTGEDFRLVTGITPEELARLTQEAEQRAAARVEDATRTAVERLHTAVKTLSERLKSYSLAEDADAKGARYYDAWVANVQELAGLMPQLNIIGDPALAQLANEAAQIASEAPRAYRDNRDLRDQTANKAGDLATRLADLLV